MPLLDDLVTQARARTESDLGDPEFQAVVAQALEDVRARYGPEAAEMTVRMDGYPRTSLLLTRAIDEAQTVTVVEFNRADIEFVGGTPEGTPVDPAELEILHGGQTLRRLNASGRLRKWAGQVEVTYTPKLDQERRNELVIKLVQLTLQYEGLSSVRVGDTSDNKLDYSQERDKLLRSLQPRRGINFA